MERNEHLPDEFVTRPEAARRTGIGLRQIRRACAEGHIPIYQIGAWQRVRWTDVLHWLVGQRCSSHEDRLPTDHHYAANGNST